MKIKMNLVKLVAPLFFILFAIGCSDDPVEDPKNILFEIQGENGFVGTVDGTDAFISLLVADKEALVYVCNGEEEIYEWFRGNITDPENISLKNGYGSQVVGKFVGQSFTGNVILTNGNSHSFTAIPNSGSKTGIFQVYGDLAAQEGIVAGWILNAKSEERGSFRLNSVFQSTPKKPKLKPVSDGTSNTISFKSMSFPIRRFSFSWHPDSVSVIQVNG